MNEKKMTCRQVQAILPFYIQGKVNDNIAAMVEEHLENCDICKEIYIKAIEEYNKFPSEEMRAPAQNFASDNINSEKYKTQSYADFKKNLSAYFDSELNDEEQFKIKKITISNPLARKDLEDLYRFKQLLHKSFERTKLSFNKDISKQILKKITQSNDKIPDRIFKYSAIIFIFALILTLSLYYSV